MSGKARRPWFRKSAEKPTRKVGLVPGEFIPNRVSKGMVQTGCVGDFMAICGAVAQSYCLAVAAVSAGEPPSRRLPAAFTG